MILFLDWETTFQVDEKGRTDPSPYIPENYVVSYGVGFDDTVEYYCIQHNEKAPDQGAALERLQELLDNTTLLVAHHIKFELQWLHALGLKYEGKVACTMIREYVLAKGTKLPVGLGESCERNNVAHKKSELIEGYLKQKIGFEAIPWDIVEEYGIGDIISCKELYYNQLARLEKDNHLWPTIELMEEFAQCLTDIEDNGIKIDVVELNRLEIEYKTELNALKIRLLEIAKEVMGNVPLNLDSPEQLSQVLFSRKVTDKDAWKTIFNLGTEKRGSVIKPKRRPKMSMTDFVKYVKLYTEPVYIQTAEHCNTCNGIGRVDRIKLDGSLSKQRRLCLDCSGYGYIIRYSEKIAGFRFIPSGVQETAIGGFSTSYEVLERLKYLATGTAREFLEGLERQNSISTYLDTFIAGIRRGLRHNDILHPTFMQCVTATGRLSSRNPNFQNQPRTNTFPVRKCIISRFGKEGLILSGDAKQLEFRIAGELSGDKMIFEDVTSGVDVHAATAAWTGYSRQDSKPYTFAPVYGATDKGKPDNIAAYFRYFQARYNGLFSAHKEWQNLVLESGSYILPSGRQFLYPGTQRYSSGGVSNSTIIANYPVQGFATADLMPIFCINTWLLYKKYGLKSLVMLEVHDDVTADVYPGELEIAAKLMVDAFNSIPEECIRRYNYVLKMPLEVELKVGPNWMEQKEYKI